MRRVISTAAVLTLLIGAAPASALAQYSCSSPVLPPAVAAQCARNSMSGLLVDWVGVDQNGIGMEDGTGATGQPVLPPTASWTFPQRP